MDWVPTFCQALFKALQIQHWAKLTCLARAGNPVEKADRPRAEHMRSNQWLDGRVWRAQEGEGKEPLKYFRGVAQEAKLELNGKPELCMEVCLHRQEKGKVRSVSCSLGNGGVSLLGTSWWPGVIKGLDGSWKGHGTLGGILKSLEPEGCGMTKGQLRTWTPKWEH